jgi:hypothetical protein
VVCSALNPQKTVGTLRPLERGLKDFLPVDATLNATTVQNHTLQVAQRCEDELGEEQWAFVEGCPADWETLPIPDGPITVGIDGGYVHNWEAKQQHFEVIVGKSILAFRRDNEEDIASSKCFGFVQTLDEKPKRRLFEVLKSQGHQMNQQLTFLSDGGDRCATSSSTSTRTPSTSSIGFTSRCA